MYALLGLERRPTKCHLAIVGPAAGRITVWCKHWLSKWTGDRLELVEGDPVPIRQEEKGNEVRYLGLTDDEDAGTFKARMQLAATARRAAKVYGWTRCIHQFGRAFARGVLAPKIAYPVTFSKATRPQLEALEGGYGTMLRHSTVSYTHLTLPTRDDV